MDVGLPFGASRQAGHDCPWVEQDQGVGEGAQGVDRVEPELDVPAQIEAREAPWRNVRIHDMEACENPRTHAPFVERAPSAMGRRDTRRRLINRPFAASAREASRRLG